MTGGSIIDLGKLTEPATRLIDRIADATGVLYEPRRIRKRAEAEADAALILARGQADVDEFRRQAAARITSRELRRQANIEQIAVNAVKALPSGTVEEAALDEDWIFRFFGECQDISDREMQELWGRMLAGEFARPGSFSLRTLATVRNMTQHDARQFSKMTCAIWNSDTGQAIAMLPNIESETLDKLELSYTDILQFQALGLLAISESGTVITDTDPGSSAMRISYFGEDFRLSLPSPQSPKNLLRPDGRLSVSVGVVVLLSPGVELLRICNAKPNPELKRQTLRWFEKQGLEVVPTAENSSNPADVPPLPPA